MLDKGNEDNGYSQQQHEQGGIDAKEEMQKRDENNSDSDSEFDYLLDEDLPTNDTSYNLQTQRRAELESQAHHHEIVRYHGYGVHRQMHPRRVFPSVGFGAGDNRGPPPPRGSILHLHDPHSQLSASLDLCLEQMSNRYPGTKFVRGVGITAILYADDYNSSCSEDWKKGDLPLLLALKDGRVVAHSSGLRDFYNSNDKANEVEPRVVEQWLDYAGVLIDVPPPMEDICRIRPEEDMLLENSSSLFFFRTRP